MKMIFVLFAFTFQGTVNASNCPNFTGTFASQQDQAWPREWTYTQKNCESIQIKGKWTWPNGAVTNRNSVLYNSDGYMYSYWPDENLPVKTLTTWTMNQTELTIQSRAVTTEGACLEKHVLRLDTKGNLIDKWGWYCDSGKNYEFSSIDYRIK